ncbi:hypothetical protein F5Y19DRAFT_489025 [Xylariaceae sp. FL1651]|nr:hypothetical protein F5Y19DRAFT_489025 [Xylariaceae sp. FL1651]
MHFYKHLFTLGLGLLTVWGTPIAPATNSKTCAIEDQSATDVLDKRAAPVTVPVTVWKDLGEGAQTHATYVATLSTASTGALDHSDLGQYAKKGYDNMMSQKPRKKDTNLMAALYIPSAQSIFLSSVPDGPAIGEIKRNGAANAPAWWSRVKHRESALYLHAEDSVAYRYETSLKTKLSPGGTYPPNSLIAVYGSVNGANAAVVPLCAGGGDMPIDPPCSAVFRNLRINF